MPASRESHRPSLAAIGWHLADCMHLGVKSKKLMILQGRRETHQDFETHANLTICRQKMSTKDHAPLVSTLSQKPFIIGVLGDSITYGANVRRGREWPRVLEKRLRRVFGDNVRVINGAVRASSADFAALCWDEIWGPEWQGPDGSARAPPMRLAIIDYSFTSSSTQLGALIDRCYAKGIPVLATLYCPHDDWYTAWQAFAAEHGSWHGAIAGWCGAEGLPKRAEGDCMARIDRSARRFILHKPRPSELNINRTISACAERQPSCPVLFAPFTSGNASAEARATEKALAAALDSHRLPPSYEATIKQSWTASLAKATAPVAGAPAYAALVPTQSGRPLNDSVGMRASAFSLLLHKLLTSRRKHKGERVDWAGLHGATAGMKRQPGSLAEGLQRLMPIAEAEQLVMRLMRPGEEGTEKWYEALAMTVEKQCFTTRHGPIVNLLRRRRVPFVSNAAALRLDARAAMRDDRHPGVMGHEIIAEAVEQSLLLESSCASPQLARAASRPLSPQCLASLPMPRAHGGHGRADRQTMAKLANGQTCRLGRSLNISVVRSVGFRYVMPADHRTPGLVAEYTGAECILRCRSASLAAGYLSLTLERSHRNVGTAEISCMPPCFCLPTHFDAHAVQKYSFSQRSRPRWTVLGNDGVCDIRVRVLELAQGRLMVHALTYSAALAGNKSVDTNSLYSLLGHAG